MERYIAFLRGINVSGQKVIRMEALRKVFVENGFTHVKTYIQSGNVIFNSDETEIDELIQKIEEIIETHFGFHTDIILRKHVEIESILKTLQISRSKSAEDKKYYITFLQKESKESLIVPLFSKNKDVEVIHQNNKDFVSISHPFKGNYGFPNAFIELLTAIPATTRNPNTLKKLLEL